MKTSRTLFLVLGLAAASSGCINLSFGSRKAPSTPPPPPQIVSPSPALNPADAATIAEIDAAARLHFDSSRQEALAHIAERPALSPVAQVHLVNVAYRCLAFENAKLAVLRQVIANPAFCDTTRQAIVTQLNHLSFDANKQTILRELNQRMTSS
jgi:hypothetical protein